MCNIDTIGSQWASEKADNLTHEIEQLSPVEFNQLKRFLPASVTSDPGYINFDRTPYWIEILECFDVRSPVREVAILKDVQTAYSTVLESILLYFAGHIRTAPVMYANATVDMARARIKRNYLPMFQQSGFGDIFQSSDVENSRKRGITKDELQWVGGGYLVPKGAQTSHMMTDISIMLMLMDELDRWPDVKDGDPVQLFKDRTKGFTYVRKILMGSTPGISGSSRIDEQWERGDQRKYQVRCLKCGMPQEMRFDGKNKNGTHYGIEWDFLDGGKTLDIDSVRYCCKNCRNAHMEHDRVRLISKNNAFWDPTNPPVEPFLRSYQVTGMMNRRAPWYKGVSMYLEAFDNNGKVKNTIALQRFYNNFLAKSFHIYTGKIQFQMASAHRRPWYRKGEIKNSKVSQYCDSDILFLTCTVDVHGDNLAVAVWGWARVGMDYTCWLIEYLRIPDGTDIEEGCSLPESPAWGALREILDEKVWTSDDNKKYQIELAFVDAGAYTSTVCGFCSEFEFGVYPIMGRGTSSKTRINEWQTFVTKIGTTGYLLEVDHYKERLAPVLRRSWRPEDGNQDAYTLNAPVDTTDEELRELTREVKRKKKTGATGRDEWEWHRPGNAPNELWDLLVYGNASVEIFAWMVSEYLQQVPASQVIVDWHAFWAECEGAAFFEA